MVGLNKETRKGVTGKLKVSTLRRKDCSSLEVVCIVTQEANHSLPVSECKTLATVRQWLQRFRGLFKV